MSSLLLKKDNRSDSLESIPEAEFVHNIVKEISEDFEASSLVSEFKIKEKNGEYSPEPLLIEDKTRFVLFPIKHNDVRDITKF